VYNYVYFYLTACCYKADQIWVYVNLWFTVDPRFELGLNCIMLHQFKLGSFDIDAAESVTL